MFELVSELRYLTPDVNLAVFLLLSYLPVLERLIPEKDEAHGSRLSLAIPGNDVLPGTRCAEGPDETPHKGNMLEPD